MKTGVSLSVFHAREGMPVLYSTATDEHLDEIKSLGFDGVDLFVLDPKAQETKDALAGLEKRDLGIGVIMPAALAREGLFLGSKDQNIQQEAIRRISEIIELASTCKAMVSLGLVRGSYQEDDTPEAFLLRYKEACEELLKIAQPLNVDLLIEPINHKEINTINRVKECVQLLKEWKLPLYIMADTYHMNLEDDDILNTLKEALPYTKHIHFVDENRLAPSMGTLDMETLYRMLEENHYQGYLCMEVLPLPDPTTCARNGANFFKKMKEE